MKACPFLRAAAAPLRELPGVTATEQACGRQCCSKREVGGVLSWREACGVYGQEEGLRMSGCDCGFRLARRQVTCPKAAFIARYLKSKDESNTASISEKWLQTVHT